MSDFDCDGALASEAPAPVVRAPCVAQRGAMFAPAARDVPEETAIALSFNGATHAVMMATPADFEDFAIGFAFTEGLIDKVSDLSGFEMIPTNLGVELRGWLPAERANAYAARRRAMAGPTGCGLCGIESLEQAMRAAPRVSSALSFDRRDVTEAIASLAAGQLLNEKTHAVHAAGFWTPARGLVAAREDVGRHNALDKLAGALLREGVPAGEGLVLLTSRVSVELIQKVARMGAPAVVAISAPTAAAIRLADACGVTLVAVARGRDFEVFTHHARIIDRVAVNVA
ncbi:formate dehydrogenase family accessory protein FdhD [Methylocella silvestris BL2]|uniref:Sulfur carrier protein FdhD n=1 Tax=Methylocella silvestris (strain DSM 15510 / CIP 108128 / LMG 27833 / NCIMB 13906 / BL2) TaxID=395965 RepID=B8EJ50_METSB|nr:formate dehydrogenase accessory sulfurtransferase FdhD [Methylocella silvestris]ACK52542.1 formate dehydrogenase family accessory protein FdhD [Methylocella silvestris BL2]